MVRAVCARGVNEMKRVTLALFLAVAGVAQASFELAFVADGFDSGSSGGRIHRYDAATGSYFGTFGESYYTYRDIVANGQNGRLYALDAGGSLLEYDYSTGLLLRARPGISGTNIGLSADSTELHVWSGSTINRVSTSTLQSVGTITLAVGTATVSSFQRIGSSFYTVSSVGTDTWAYQRYSLAGSLLSTGSSYGSASTPGKLGYIVNGSTDTPNILMSGLGPGDAMRYAFLSASGALSLTGTFFPALGQEWVDVAPLHSGGLFLGKDKSDPTRGIVAVAGYTGGVFRSFGSGQIKTPVALTTVVTPEPATLVALGAGLALLARRRKRG